jgi:hypothetical protein
MATVNLSYDDWENQQIARLGGNWLTNYLTQLQQGNDADPALTRQLAQDGLLLGSADGEGFQNWTGVGSFTKPLFDKYNVNTGANYFSPTNFRLGDMEKELLAFTQGRGRNADGTVSAYQEDSSHSPFAGAAEMFKDLGPLPYVIGGAAGLASLAGLTGAGAAGAAGAAVAPEVGALYSGLDAAALAGTDLVGAGLAGAGAGAAAGIAPEVGSLFSGLDATTLAGTDLAGAGAAGAAGTAIGGAAGTTATAATSAAAQTALQKIMSGTATAADYAALAGQAIPSLIGAYASNQQADAIRAISDQSRADRAPFLAKSLEWLNNPQAYADGPGASTLQGVLRQLSATHGNPIDSPTALGIATDAGMRDWRSAVTGFGNLGLGNQDLLAQLGLKAAGADSNVWGALGIGAANVFNPPKTIADLMGTTIAPDMSKWTTAQRSIYDRQMRGETVSDAEMRAAIPTGGTPFSSSLDSLMKNMNSLV